MESCNSQEFPVLGHYASASSHTHPSDDVTSPPWCLPVKFHFLYIKAPRLSDTVVRKTSESALEIKHGFTLTSVFLLSKIC